MVELDNLESPFRCQESILLIIYVGCVGGSKTMGCSVTALLFVLVGLGLMMPLDQRPSAKVLAKEKMLAQGET